MFFKRGFDKPGAGLGPQLETSGAARRLVRATRVLAALLPCLGFGPAMAYPDADEYRLRDLATRQTDEQIVNIQEVAGDGRNTTKWYALEFENHPDRLFFTRPDASFYTSVDVNGEVVYHRHDLTPIAKNDKTGRRSVFRKALSTMRPNEFIDVVRGRPEKTLYVVTDPQCPYCVKLARMFDARFDERDNVRIRYIFMPLESHPQAKRIASSIYCSRSPGEALVEWFRTLRDDLRPAGEDCEFRANAAMFWPVAMGVHMVPTVFFEDGREYVGQFDMARIRNQLGLPAR